ncbi:MAG: LacI family DNA-binding transcriptional regulator [Lachnospiraceae bacterium]|nr:LacI family DNA-binding transcriptional regulator [Lachnospiraceae bacterium]
MSITAKELAKKLGLSETAVSMALNHKPGVSTKTRQEVIRLAEECGYDFTKIKKGNSNGGSIYVISYRTHNAILSYAPIFDTIYDGVKSECQQKNYKVKMIQFYEKNDSLEDCFADLRGSDCTGLILIGTEMRQDICTQFLNLGYPMVLLDTYFDSLDCTSVLINNRQGAYLATDYLIRLRHKQPGYLQSAYSIPNFNERFEGYTKALKENGMSPSRSRIHALSPSIESAMTDMLEIIDRKDPLATSYFADNDMIAIGALKALKLRGYKIPEDISIIGFDNISESKIIEPALTTMDVPRFYLGQTAAKALLEQFDTTRLHATKIEVSPKLIKRFSHCEIPRC